MFEGCLGNVWLLSGCCLGAVLGMLWGCFGVALGMLWGCFGDALGMFWGCFNGALAPPPGGSHSYPRLWGLCYFFLYQIYILRRSVVLGPTLRDVNKVEKLSTNSPGLWPKGVSDLLSAGLLLYWFF